MQSLKEKKTFMVNTPFIHVAWTARIWVYWSRSFSPVCRLRLSMVHILEKRNSSNIPSTQISHQFSNIDITFLVLRFVKHSCKNRAFLCCCFFFVCSSPLLLKTWLSRSFPTWSNPFSRDLYAWVFPQLNLMLKDERGPGKGKRCIISFPCLTPISLTRSGQEYCCSP